MSEKRALTPSGGGAAAAERLPNDTEKKKNSKFVRFWPLYVMFLPGAVYLVINNYIPMAGLVVAFKDYSARKGIWGSDWCGLKNFEFLFSTPDAARITRNTILYNAAFILTTTVVGIIFAILICDTINKTAKKAYQSAILFPYLMSTVVIGYIVYAFLSAQTGIVNKSFMGGEGSNWYAVPEIWPWVLVFVNLWKGVGYGCLIYISTINGIDTSLFEAATLDGATKMQQIRFVTLPELKTTVITLTLMSIGRIFYSDFGLFYQVPRNAGALYNVTDVIDTYVYRGLMVQNDIGMSAAAGFYQSIVGFCVVMLANYVVRKIDSQSALF